MDVTYEGGTKREVATDKGGTLRYHEAGDGPPLILLHGSGIGVSGWRNYRGGNLEVFAKHFHCYLLEFPGGFGVSDASTVIQFSRQPRRWFDSWMRWESNPLR